MSNTSVLYGGRPLNISISDPLLNGGEQPTTGPSSGSPDATDATPVPGSEPVAAGTVLRAIRQGQNPIPALVAAPIPAFRAVVFRSGGVVVADPGVASHRQIVAGLSISDAVGGGTIGVAWSGPVVNTLSGSDGWNFVIGDPVYVGADGRITATAPLTGWRRAVGFAIAGNAILIDLSDRGVA